jgi:hypothetical protein
VALFLAPFFGPRYKEIVSPVFVDHYRTGGFATGAWGSITDKARERHTAPSRSSFRFQSLAHRSSDLVHLISTDTRQS